MNQDIITTVTEFGIALIERQHQFFADETCDNSEHVPAIKRIADVACQFLKLNRISSEAGKKVTKELIQRGRELFINEWMRQMDEDEEPPDEEDEKEARRTFDKLLKK